MKIDSLIITLFTLGMLGFSGCVDAFKKEEKITKVLLAGKANEMYHKLSEEYFIEGNYTGALENDLKQLKEDLKYYPDVSAEIAVDYNNIGLDHAKLKEYQKALEFYTKVRQIDEVVFDRRDSKKATTVYNMASAYEGLNDNLNALKFYQQSLALDVNKEQILLTHEDIARVYEKQNNLNQALSSYKASLALRHKLHDKKALETLRLEETIALLSQKLKK